MIYVCSDIHGQYKAFQAMLDKIAFSENDHMYVIGDAIDRGPDPIMALLDVLTTKNITFLLGNHEYMMINAVTSHSRYDYDLWMSNGSATTIQQAKQMDIQLDELCQMLVQECPVIIPCVNVNNKHYYLVHAMNLPKFIDKPQYFTDLDEYELESVLWERFFTDPITMKSIQQMEADLYSQYADTTLIIGHTPIGYCWFGRQTQKNRFRISRTCGHLIAIDCGCAGAITLGCLRLDDMKEFYVDISRRYR